MPQLIKVYRPILLLCLIIMASISQVQAGPLVRHTVMVDNHELALWQKDSESYKATVLLLHGRTWSALPDFDLQVSGEEKSFMDGLNEKDLNVYALDQRGYGATKRDATGWLTPDRAAKDVIGIVNWIRKDTPGPVIIFGWSYGSMVTQMVAQREPTLADAIVLFGYPFNPKRHIVSKRKKYPAQPPSEINTAKNAASDFIVPNSINDNAIQAYVTAALAADPVRVDFKNLHEWAELDAEEITTPTLLLQGEFDPLAPSKMQNKFFAKIDSPRKWHVVLAGGDHAALLETPREEMLGAIDAFIDGLLSAK